MQNLLLMSNSTMPGTPFFTWPRPFVKAFLPENSGKIVFIPFAAVTISFDEYTAFVEKAFSEMDFSLSSIHTVDDKVQAIRSANAIVTGGGNTFALASRMYQHNLIGPVREKVSTGTPYIGWSAGANLACPTIMTTNDMPIIQPPSFNTLNLIPFQINPHYHELKFENQGGETRKERLQEFIQMNPQRRVVGLPEGMLLRQHDNILKVHGEGVAKLYQHSMPVQEIATDTDLSHLLHE